MPKTVYFIILILLFTGCKKPVESDLPPYTTVGNNSFGCYIDDEPFVASVSFSIGGAVAVSGSFDHETRLLKIQGVKEDSNDRLSKVSFKAIIDNGLGSYSMLSHSDSNEGFYDFSGVKCEYYHDTLNKGDLVIMHLDEDKRIISGVFAMDLVNPDCYYKTMHITDGRFDFGY